MLKTMAIRITKETYPIAAACLPVRFLLVQPERVIGCFLVINEKAFHDTDNADAPRTITFDNAWYCEEDFLSAYKWSGLPPFSNQFGEITHL